MTHSPDADRNLLFAVLALQADCLTPSRFVEACTLWASQKTTPIAELLVERGWLSADERADVQRLLERKLAKHSGDARAGLAEATADHAVRQSIAAVPDADVLGTLSNPPPAGHVLLATTDFVPEEGDRYTVTRLHATGGIGRVWLAHDGTLGRDVALKELRPERAASPDVWARFLREARITGQLEHPGIVPIYELGARGPDGHPFYTMRFVRGQTLREKVAAYHQRRQRGELGPLDLRELLTAFVGVCNAVGYAHSRGIIHRDLKPANVVLGEFGVVMVLDWGLAKSVTSDQWPVGSEGTGPELAATRRGASSDDATGTLEGQVLGTPAYMAPEQADGRLGEIDRRTDVYGLGAILYEILTGHPPFDGQSTEDVLSRVRTLEPARPRDRVPATPPALEAICLKALRKRPGDRYGSAEALADDIVHFLADEPTTAYREPVTVRVWRAARRHRTLVTGLVAALAVAVPTLVVGMVLINQSEQRERAARQREEVARKDEQEARERAQANYAKSLRAADAMAEELARGVRPIAGTQSKNVLTILDRARQVYDDLLSDPDAPPEALARKAAMLVQFAELYRQTNRSGPSRKAAEEAITLYDRLLAERPDDRNLRIGRGTARHRLAWALWDQGFDDDALAAFRAVVAELEAVGVENDPVVTATVLASAYTFEGNILVAHGGYDGAERAYRRGLDLRRKALAAGKDDPDVRAGLALSLERFGLFLINQRDDVKGGLDLLREARTVLEVVCRADPWNAAHHLSLVRSINSLVQVTRDPAETAAALDACQAVVDRFARRDPDHLVWHRESLRLKYNRMEERIKAARREDDPNLPALRLEAIKVLEELLAATTERNRQDPENYLWAADVGNFEGRLANAHLALARPGKGGEHLDRAAEYARASVRHYEPLLARAPGNVENAQGLLVALDAIVRVEERRGNVSAATVARWEYQAGSVGLYQRLAARHPNHKQWAARLRGAYSGAGLALRPDPDDLNWKATVARPEAIVAAVRLAAVLAENPAGLPADALKQAAPVRKTAVTLLEKFDAAGVLTPDGKAVLAKLLALPPPPEEKEDKKE